MKDITLAPKTKKKIKRLLNESNEIQEYIYNFKIKDQEDFDLAVALIEELKSKQKYLETEKNSINKPLNEIRAKVSSWFNPSIQAISICITSLRDKLIEYESYIEQKQLLEAKTKKRVTKKAQSNKVSYRENWTYRITDFDNIPRDYLSLDHSKVKIELREKKEKLKIPGIKFFLERIPIVRNR